MPTCGGQPHKSMGRLTGMQDPSITLTYAFVALISAELLLRLWLVSRQVAHVAGHRSEVPRDFSASVDLAAHHKAADYTLAKARLGLAELALGTALVLGWTLLGGLQTLNQLLLSFMEAGMQQQLALLASFMLVGMVIELPMAWFNTFRLEESFGFNKTTFNQWLSDGLKGAGVAAVFGLPLAALVLWLMATAGDFWWAWAWAVFMGFNLLMMVIYPTLIAPLFNKFEPLSDDNLKDRVTQLMKRCGFQAKGLYVMDGSRRSAHANAYFTGFGAAKRVVFFDTLLSQLSPSEVDAVLAHELGHYHHKHIAKRLVAVALFSLAGFALLGWLSSKVWFYTGLGVEPNLSGPNDALALLLFTFITPPLSFMMSPFMAASSRKHEFEADAYAAAHTDAASLRSALLKLYRDNASTLTPDPLYVRFHYSHPPAGDRLARLVA